MRTGCLEVMIGRGSKGAVADGGCPCTMYDLGSERAGGADFLMRVNDNTSQ